MQLSKQKPVTLEEVKKQVLWLKKFSFKKQKIKYFNKLEIGYYIY
jgi:hypothetical protein